MITALKIKHILNEISQTFSFLVDRDQFCKLLGDSDNIPTLTSTSVNCSAGREVMAAMLKRNIALLLILSQSLIFKSLKLCIDIYKARAGKTLPIL